MGNSGSSRMYGLDTDKQYQGDEKEKSSSLSNEPTQATLEVFDTFDTLAERCRKSLRIVENRNRDSKASISDIREMMVENERSLRRFNREMGFQPTETEQIEQYEKDLGLQKEEAHKLHQEVKKLQVCLECREQEIERLKAELKRVGEISDVKELATSDGQKKVEIDQATETTECEMLDQLNIKIPNKPANRNFWQTIQPPRSELRPPFSITLPTKSRKSTEGHARLDTTLPPASPGDIPPKSPVKKKEEATFRTTQTSKSDYGVEKNSDPQNSVFKVSSEKLNVGMEPPISSETHDYVVINTTSGNADSLQSMTDSIVASADETARNKSLQTFNMQAGPVLSTQNNTTVETTESAEDTYKSMRETSENDPTLTDANSIFMKKTPQDPLHNVEQQIDDLRSEVQDLTARVLGLQEKNEQLEAHNEELTNRLSKIAGQRLLEDNPAITDLSDPNRPLKLGEVYCEIYDNEWTDAFEELHEAGYSEEECIDTLRLTLLNAWEFCQGKSEDMLKKTSEAVDILFEEYKQTTTYLAEMLKSFENEDSHLQLQNRWKRKDLQDPRKSLRCSMMVMTPDKVSKQLKLFRKEVADSVIPLVQRAYLSASWNSDCISAMKPFIKKCLFLGWMMVVQSPPLSFATCKPGESFNKDMYREYTKSGPKVEYVVWPTLLLHEGGPMIGKGVAQGMKI